MNAGFTTLPRSNATYTNYSITGTRYKTWAAMAGANGNVNIQAGVDVANFMLASRINSGAATTNAANTASLCLEVTNLGGPTGACGVVPVPASGWLLSSALAGLAGLIRRKNNQATFF